MTWHQNAGAAIKRAREACGLSQTAVAQKADVSQPTVSRLERGRPTDSAAFLRIAAALDAALSTGSLAFEEREWLRACANAWTVPTEGAPS